MYFRKAKQDLVLLGPHVGLQVFLNGGKMYFAYVKSRKVRVTDFEYE